MIATKWLRTVALIATSPFIILSCGHTSEKPGAVPLAAAQKHAAPASAEFCSSIVGIESVLSSSIPLIVLPPEVAEQVAGYQLSAVSPLLEKAKETAPSDISAEVDILTAGITQKLSALDFDVTLTPDFVAADKVIDRRLLADCGFAALPVTAVNYEYLGVPTSVQAGQTALLLTNESDEVHEISIARINDDVDLSPKEILSLPEEESLAAIKLVAYVEVPPGETGTTFMNLDEGRYYAVCFTPEGSMSLHALGHGAPHLFHGMLKEFAVGDSKKSSTVSSFNPKARSTPEELLALLGEYMDARDVDAILSIHEPSAGLVEWSGKVARGEEEIRQVYVDFLATEPDLNVKARQIVELDDLAIILGDYTLDFMRNGKTISTSGKFGDIVRKQPDGTWLYLLDNPWAP